jgi:hypothetical protein
MTARLRRIRNIIVLIMPLAFAACDSQPAMFVGSAITSPSKVPITQPSNVFNISPMLVPSTIPFHTLPVFGCPSASPFATSFSLIIDQRDGHDVFVHEVGFRFVDTSGFDSPLIFRQSELATLFGSTLIVAGTSRTFSFQPRFGCGLSSTPRLMVTRLLLLDRNGRTHERTLTAHAEGSSRSRRD